MSSSKTVFMFVALALFGIALARSTTLAPLSPQNTYRGNCTEDSKYKCSKHGLFQVKQCKKGEEKCHCVDAYNGVLHKKVEKEEECPACLVANAESHKMTAEGGVDMNFYSCDSEGYYSSDPQCFWYGRCVCYTKDGEVKKSVDVTDMTQEERENITCDDAESGEQ